MASTDPHHVHVMHVTCHPGRANRDREVNKQQQGRFLGTEVRPAARLFPKSVGYPSTGQSFI